jgi:hypothetical protein
MASGSPDREKPRRRLRLRGFPERLTGVSRSSAL